jgi:hypothetical protein
MAELRAVSTRAEISPTRFWNEYQWGDLKAEPAVLLERYFDAHLYFANWGTQRLLLRLPKDRVDVELLEGYFVTGHASGISVKGKHVVLEFVSDIEEPEYDEGPPGPLAALTPLREELLRGDLRPAYLAWLGLVQAENVDDDSLEPAVPAGLSNLTGAQQALVDLLRLDVDLVAAASAGAAPSDDGAPFRRWVAALSAKEKDGWLKRAAEEPDLALGGELLRTFRASHRAQDRSGRRTVGELRALAEAQEAEREKAEAAREKKAKNAADAARQRQLTKLARDVEAAWADLEKLIESSGYDEAVRLAVDLRDLAVRESAAAEFSARFEELRKRKLRRRGFFDRWKRLERETR